MQCNRKMYSTKRKILMKQHCNVTFFFKYVKEMVIFAEGTKMRPPKHCVFSSQDGIL